MSENFIYPRLFYQITLHKASVLPKSRALFNLHKDIDIYLKTKLRKIVHNVKPNDKMRLV